MYQEILDFWFTELKPSDWWKKSETLDGTIAQRFSGTHESGARCELFEWRSTSLGRLAEVIVLDQFSRNIFRDTNLAFAHDSLALALSQEAVSAGADQALSPLEKSFLYMPFMHSESLKIHEEGLRLFTGTGIAANIDFEKKHKAIIERFGRYPHRNKILGRESTEEESLFLKEPASGF
ncbi:MAG: hypothetical protein ACI9BD_000182 [Candidatus Marinamargulisbacteria bacterium]|jgi:uncharacterized protein (DUF924 family)